MVKVYDAMLSENIVIELYGPNLLSELPKEPWVSRNTASQIPAYHHVVKATLLEGGLNIEPGRVLEVLAKP